MGGCYIGLDVGAVSADFVVTDAAGNVIESRYVRTYGRPLQVSLEQLDDLLAKYDGVAGLCATGSGGKVIAQVLNVPFVNEIVAQSQATMRLHPEARTIVEIGGESSKLICLDQGRDGAPRVSDFAMNSVCSAGTGSFLDQQASRLRVSIEEFSQLALNSEHPPRVAGRCSVFAKSDMIHLQQQGTPDYDIIAGLCFAMARNFKSNLGKGKEFARPVAFQGGVAFSLGMMRAFRETLDLAENELIIPERPGCTGALGAVLDVLDKGKDASFESLDPLREQLDRAQVKAERLAPLCGDGYDLDVSCCELPRDGSKVDAYVGVDIGSISTNVVVVDSERNVLGRCYLMTEGRPLEAVKRGLHEVGQKIADRVNVRGCCTTGSGRYLSGEFVGADLVKNEITSHARGAVAIDPTVDTIFEIGGQDAKYISLDNGTVVDFAMNKVCAAGTGSFLEEQAERLGLKIEEEFGSTALASREPVKLGERCTVFMESDLVFHQQRGASTRDLVGGLSYSIVYNYLNRVVEDRRVGDHIFFQGGVAFNRGVKAAFEQVTGKKVTVPAHHEVLGAYGAAILAMEEVDGESRFKGFDLRNVGYELSTFECKGCSNRCEIHRVSIEGEKPLHYGSRCGKFEDKGKQRKGEHLPRLFVEREEALLGSYPKDEPDQPNGVTIGMPRALTFFDQFPFWKAFFSELGCKVMLSETTNRHIVALGSDHVTAETCFPIKVAHGHVADLMAKDVDYIFMPSVLTAEHEAEDIVHSYLCPLVQSMPYLLDAAFGGRDAESHPPLLSPVVHFERGRRHVSERLRSLAQMFEAPAAKAEKAIEEAWRALDAFRATCRRRGQEVLDGLGEDDVALVIVSRPYNGCDPGMNLAVPDKLRDLGVLALPIDFLPLDPEEIGHDFPHMYWKYGQNIISAARIIARHEKLHAVYVTNFRCGPDSFISKFFDRVLGEPYLTLEIDEHSSDVGAITRVEAFLDSVKSAGKRRRERKPRGEDLYFDIRERRGSLKVHIPYMDDHGRMMAAVLRANGVEAEALPMSDAQSVEAGRCFTTGKECYPCILTTGDIVKKTRAEDFDHERDAFFMAQATGPCRFGQYHKFHRMVLDDIGYERVPMVVMDQTDNFSEHISGFGPDFYRSAWEMFLIVDFLQKMVRETRPYEIEEGQTDEIYRRGLRELEAAGEAKGDYLAVARASRRRIEAVAVARSERRPLIGVVGEIYVRSNEFANNFLVRRLEKMGAQVMLPPMQEWLNYIAASRREVSWQGGKVWAFVREWLSEFAGRWSEARIARVFRGAIDVMPRESSTSEVLRLGTRYLDPTVKGEAILSMGRAVEYAHHGFHGVVNVSPFGCMPGAIVNSLLEKFRRDHGGIPVLKLEFDGQEQMAADTALEAFVHQARQYMLSAHPAHAEH